MVSINTNITRNVLKWATASLGLLSLVVVGYGFSRTVAGGTIQGRLLRDYEQREIPWDTITEQEFLSGSTIQEGAFTIITIPEEIDRITRRTMFGHRGERIRYWGICLPRSLEEAERKKRLTGLPGDMFLSEAEREHRREKLKLERRRTFSIFKNLTDNDLNETQPAPRSRIRHQVEIFKGGMTCSVMAEKPMPIGADMDNDGVNAAIERSYGIDPYVADTDADGIDDGKEIFGGNRTHPNKRDSDGDGIVEGKEDTNFNGEFDVGETNPGERDTDGDGLCDGSCPENAGVDIRGEDKNLNGIYEPEKGEYNPRVKYSDGKVRDDHRVYLCVIAGGDDC
tara:strand:- start:196 stop:1212 length:1017 start_codon:yes stop_codon:yes gene_type:complete